MKTKRWRFFSNHPRNLKSFGMKHAFELFIVFKSRDNQKIDLKSSGFEKKIALFNDIMMHGDSETRKKIEEIINKWKELWKEKSSIVQISKSVFMPISLKFNWAEKIKTNRVYSLNFKNRVFVNEIFDKFHQKEKMQWSKNSTSFEYPVFVIWKIIIKNEMLTRKGRVVVNIRGLNEIIQTDAYSMPIQTEIIVAITECFHIFIVNAQGYFYQWTVKEKNRYKQTVIIHKGQEEFSVTIMGFKNSSAYVQRQTDFMFKNFRGFARIYIDDIIIFSTSLQNHIRHLNTVFQKLAEYNVTLSPKKFFLEYPFIVLLSQMINAFEMITIEEKLTTISKLTFFKTFKELETYLDLTKWFRMYILYYVQIVEFFQLRKTLFLKKKSFKKNQKKIFSRQTFLINVIDEKYEAYQHLQKTFNKSNFFIHFNSDRLFFIDMNASKQKKFEDMTFHVLFDSSGETNIDIKRIEIQFIMFLSKQLSQPEKKYWPTKLKMTNVVWMIKKIRHLIEFCKKPPIVVFTDHAAIVELINQTFLITFNTDKFNLRLIRVFQYFFTLLIRIRIKLGRFHVISNVLSRLKFAAFNDDSSAFENLNELNTMFFETIRQKKISSWNVKSRRVNETLKIYFEKKMFLIKMNEDFFKTLKNVYETNDQWKKIKNKIKRRVNRFDIFDGIEFILKNRHIYYVSEGVTLRLCISWSLEKRIYIMIHDDHHHCGFHKIYAKISRFLYIRHLAKRLRRYIKYCKTCMKKQTIRHAFYEELHFIKILALSFHIITIDFIVNFFKTSNEMNAIFFTTNKFFKRVNLISGMTTWFVSEWAFFWLAMLQKKSWGLPKTIISDRNPKFVTVFWKVTFNHFDVIFLFFTVYHSQTDGQSKRINQTVKIILKYALMKKKLIDFFRLFFSIQATLNNFVNASIEMFSNELFYDFKILKATDFLNNDLVRTRADDDNSAIIIKQKKFMLKQKIEQAIIHAQTMAKIRYDFRHKSLNLKSEQKVFIRFHKNYKQSDLTNRKFSKQKIKSTTIVKKIKKLTYKLNIFFSWKIHSVISVIQLKSTFSENDFYEKKIAEPRSIKIENGDDSNIYEVEKIVTKKTIYIERNHRRRTHSEFRMKWFGWRDQHNVWMKKKNLDNCKQLFQKFENQISNNDNDEEQNEDIKYKKNNNNNE